MIIISAKASLSRFQTQKTWSGWMLLWLCSYRTAAACSEYSNSSVHARTTHRSIGARPWAAQPATSEHEHEAGVISHWADAYFQTVLIVSNCSGKICKYDERTEYCTEKVSRIGGNDILIFLN